jgi:hypothetical protein
MMLALLTGRGLAINLSHNADPVAGRHGHDYVYDSVVNFPIYKMIVEHSSLDTASSLDIGEHEMLKLLCTNLKEEFEGKDFVHLNFSQAPHLLLPCHPRGQLLQEVFLGKPYFFLSHFVWIGHEVRQLPAHFSTLPVPQSWDGVHSLNDFIHQLRSSPNVARVIGMHIRVHTHAPFIYLDHRHFNGSDKLEHSAYCKGHPGSLEDFQECIGSLVAPESAGEHTQESVVVLWATDNDELASGVLQHLQSLARVHVVRIAHEGKDRTDQLPWTGMLDVSMLEEADVLIGTTSSTFSYTAHARGLTPAYYPSFRGSRSTACGEAVGSEAGLLFFGAMYDDCNWVSPARVKCGQYRDGCLNTLSGPMGLGKCLQTLAPCLAQDMDWVSQYLIDVDIEALSLNYLARRHVHIDLDDQSSAFQTCEPLLAK